MRVEAGLGGEGLSAEETAGETAVESKMIKHGLPVGELLLAELTVEDAIVTAATGSSRVSVAVGCPTSWRQI